MTVGNYFGSFVTHHNFITQPNSVASTMTHHPGFSTHPTKSCKNHKTYHFLCEDLSLKIYLPDPL